MMGSVRIATLLCVGLSMGCGASRPGPVAGIDERYALPEAARAAERAPDLMAASRRARAAAARAESEGDVAAAEDHATRARLLLAAAVAELERIELEERRLAAEASERRPEAALGRHLAAQATVDREAALVSAARIARAEAERVRVLAADDERQRRRAGAAERAETHEEAARVLTRRAEQNLAAAIALGAPADAVARVGRAREQLRDSVEPAAARVELAVRLLLASLEALGVARAGHAAPNWAERAALFEALSQAGYAPQVDDEGLRVTVDAAIDGAARSARSQAALGAIAQILAAHPHGPAIIRLGVSGPGERRRGDSMAQRFVDALVRHGMEAQRLTPEVRTDGTAAAALVLPAYGARVPGSPDDDARPPQPVAPAMAAPDHQKK